MWLTLTYIDTTQRDPKDHAKTILVEYEILVNSALIKHITPCARRDTCQIVYNDASIYLVRHSLADLHKMVTQTTTKEVTQPNAVVSDIKTTPEPKKLTVEPLKTKGGTTSSALD